MGLTAHENENLKEGGAPNMPPENSFYYSWTHTQCPPFYIQRQERRRDSATCCNLHALEKFEAGGRNSLSAAKQLDISQKEKEKKHCCLPHICI